MINRGKKKSVAFIILVSVYTYTHIYTYKHTFQYQNAKKITYISALSPRYYVFFPIIYFTNYIIQAPILNSTKMIGT